MENLIFDMDGVLINSEPFHFRVWQTLLERDYGIVFTFEQVEDTIGSTGKTFLSRITKLYGIEFPDYEKIMGDYQSLKMEMIEKEGLPEIKGVKETLQKLHEKGYQIVVASSSALSYIRFVLRTLDIEKYFVGCCSGEDCAHPKPAPDVFLKAADMLGADPSDCIVVEDSTNGVLAAVNAGMKCLGFVNPGSGKQDLSRANQLFYSYGELEGLIEQI